MKKYIVRLTPDERRELVEFVKKQKGSFLQVRRAQILLKADADGAGCTDEQIGDALECHVRTVENVRKRFCKHGLQLTMDGLPRAKKAPFLTGEQEAKIIALRLSEPPKGFSRWTLRLLAEKAVELNICEHISHQTVKRLLKKTR
ncbi:MAG: helix-turn-helix domain-containing protein [Thermoguttaceae bacterium]|jgi:transposase|nr:helix-turn-helix domain-containing protein [Thermoguttaceae bacterium]